MSRINLIKIVENIEEKYSKNLRSDSLMAAGYENRIGHYQNQILKLNDEIQELRGHLACKESEISKQKNIIEFLSSDLEQEKLKASLTTREIFELNEEVGRLFRRLTFFSENSGVLQEELNSALTAQTLSLQKLDTANKKIENIQAELMEALNAKKTVESQLKEMIQRKNKIFQDFQNKCNQCDELEKKLKAINDQLRLKSRHITELTRSNKVYITQKQEIEKQYEILKEKFDLNEKKNSDSSQLEELKQQLAITEREFQKEKQKIEKEYKQKIKERDGELNQLKSNFNSQKNLLDGQKNKNKSQEEKISRLEKNSEEKDKEIRKLTKNLQIKDKEIKRPMPGSETTPLMPTLPLCENITRLLGSKKEPLDVSEEMNFVMSATSLTFKQHLERNFINKDADQIQNLEKDIMKKQLSCAALLDLYVPLLSNFFGSKDTDTTRETEEKLIGTIDFLRFQVMYPAFARYILALGVVMQIQGTANELQKTKLVDHLQIAASPPESDEGLPAAQYALALMYDSKISLTLMSVEPNQTEADKYYKMVKKHGFLSGIKNKLTESSKDQSQLATPVIQSR